jgi:hypothetical protein
MSKWGWVGVALALLYIVSWVLNADNRAREKLAKEMADSNAAFEEEFKPGGKWDFTKYITVQPIK